MHDPAVPAFGAGSATEDAESGIGNEASGATRSPRGNRPADKKKKRRAKRKDKKDKIGEVRRGYFDEALDANVDIARVDNAQ